MAGPQQQPPYLHLAELTASQFLEIWKHFDADGNGYIEGKELENFFQELEKARKGSGMMSKSDNFGEKMKEFMQKYDKNSDGKIDGGAGADPADRREFPFVLQAARGLQR